MSLPPLSSRQNRRPIPEDHTPQSMPMGEHDEHGIPLLHRSDEQVRLHAFKQARRRAEQDAQLLANRLALLKSEEARAWKKIDETRRRAHEIMKIRLRNEAQAREKEEIRRQREAEILQKQVEHQKVVEHARNNGGQKRSRILEFKQHDVELIRHQAKELQEEIARSREEEEMKAKRAKDEVRRAEREAQKKLRLRREAAREKSRVDWESRIASEDQLRQEKESIVARMEKAELEIIQRLQNTQNLQRAAYEELEAALAASNARASLGPNSGGSSVLLSSGSSNSMQSSLLQQRVSKKYRNEL